MRGAPVELRGRGGELQGFAVVDHDDLPLVSDRSWHLAVIGYAMHNKTYLHRVVMGLSRGDGLAVDHINGDKLDNRRANLRLCTQAENCQNKTVAGWGTSKYRGVSWDKERRRWMARGKLNGRQFHLGRFHSEEEAAAVAAAFRAEHLPFSQEAMAA